MLSKLLKETYKFLDGEDIFSVGHGKIALMFVLLLFLCSIMASVSEIKIVNADGTIYIRADGSIDPPTAPIKRAENIYTLTSNIYGSIVVERDNIVIDGGGYTLQGTGTGNGIGLSGKKNVTIKNFEINQFGNGIYMENSHNNTIIGNNLNNNDCGFSSWHLILIYSRITSYLITGETLLLLGVIFRLSSSIWIYRTL